MKKEINNTTIQPNDNNENEKRKTIVTVIIIIIIILLLLLFCIFFMSRCSIDYNTESSTDIETTDSVHVTTQNEDTSETETSEKSSEGNKDTTVDDTTVDDIAVDETTVDDTTEDDATAEDTTAEDTTEEDTTEVEATAEDTSEAEETKSNETSSETKAEPSTTATKEESHTAPSSLVVDVIDPPTASPSKPVTPSTTAPTTVAVVPVSIEVTVNGTHYLGDTLRAQDFTVKVTYSDGSVVTNPLGWTATNLSLNSASNGIVVSYCGLTTTVSVSASERPTVAPTQAPTVAPTQAPTTAPTTVAPTTVAPTTQAPTTAAPTTAAPTTAAPTTAAPTVSTLPENGTILREASIEYFNLINAERASLGIPQLAWDEELYNKACKCALAVAQAIANGAPEDNSLHNYSEPYTLVHITGASGHEYDIHACENLSQAGYYIENKFNGQYHFTAIKESPGHYRRAISTSFDTGSCAIIYYEGRTVASSLLWYSNEYLYY